MTSAIFPSPLDPANLLPNLLLARAQDSAAQPFLVDTAGETVTYRSFHDRVLRWVAVLEDLGVAAGDTVAVMLPTSIDEQCTWLACGWLRALQVPINTAYRGQMLHHVLVDAGPRVAIASPDYARLIDDARAGTRVEVVVIVGDDDHPEPHHVGAADLLHDSERSVGVVPVEANEIAAIIYTSGTTGPSKGVLVPWGQLATALAAFDDMEHGDTLYAPFAAFHLGGKLPLQVVAYWHGTFVFRDGFRTQSFWDDVRAHGCNRAWLFHAMANFVLQQPPRADDLDNPLVTVTGGPLLADYQTFQRRFGVSMRTNYGSTELGWPIATGDTVTDHLSCGRARPGYDLVVADEAGRPLGVDEIGELLVRPHLPHTMNAGYFGRPEATAAAWRDGWFHTGDAFRVDSDGRWYFVDRVKDAIRRRGENVSSFEVESMVNAHDAVLESAVIGVPSDDGEEEIKAYVVRVDGSDITAGELIDAIAPTMPRFMVPRYVEFLDELPKTPTSKVRKVELRTDPLNDRTWDRLGQTVS
jgi:crotonobetaine/carnitine-CoA ligase